MATITVSREVGSLGSRIADALAAQLGFAKLDKESLEGLLAKLGMAEARFESYDEKKPSFWQSFSAERQRYVAFLKTALYRTALDGDCVVVGRGGHIVFRGVPGVLRIRVIAPRELRAVRIRERFGVDEQRALHIMRQSDHDRAGYHRFFFNEAWDSPSGYDLVLNTEAVSAEAACEAVTALLRSPAYAGAQDKARGRLRELCTAQDVVMAILYRDRAPVDFLEVTCSGGTVTLRGLARTEPSLDQCTAIARSVEGVTEVVNLMMIASYGLNQFYT
jgi:cytidylate kinase